MTLLSPAEPPALPVPLAAELDAAHAFALNEKPAATRRAYRSDFSFFTSWCRARGVAAMPASAEAAAAFLAAQATDGAKASTIARKAAAIGYAHKLAGHEPPTNTEAVKAVLRGIRRTIGTFPTRKAPATADRIVLMVAKIPDTLTGTRDRALLLLGFSGALRRSELVALTVSDILDVEGGLRISIRRSKTDQDGKGHEIAIPAGGKLRVVEAVRTWLAVAAISAGPLFRPINKGGRVLDTALTDRSVANLVKAYAAHAGLDPDAYAGHSLRAGFLTSAAEHGANIFKMMEVSRHTSVDTLRGYIRRADLFKDHAGKGFL